MTPRQTIKDRRKLSDNKIVIGVSVALCVNVLSSYALMQTSLAKIETELVYIRNGLLTAATNKSELDKREGFMSTTNFRLNYLEREIKKMPK